jgi:hypothetical protein
MTDLFDNTDFVKVKSEFLQMFNSNKSQSLFILRRCLTSFKTNEFITIHDFLSTKKGVLYASGTYIFNMLYHVYGTCNNITCNQCAYTLATQFSGCVICKSSNTYVSL